MRPRHNAVAVVVGFAAAAALTLSFALAHAHPFGNPRTVSAASRESLLHDAAIPDQAKRVLVAKCADCHSETTRWPVYSRVAPASWLIERDVVKGRAHMNLSNWIKLSEDEREVLKTEIVQQTRKGGMPPLQYRIVHRDVVLSASDLAALALLNPKETAGGGDLREGDAVHGKAVFERKCTGCHSLDDDHEGPRLRGVFNRQAASIPGFDYSSAIRKSGLTWTDVNLERWIRDSDAMLPGTAMGFSVPKIQDRADIVAFLKTQK